MSETLKRNKFFSVALVATILFAGLTFGNLPGPEAPKGVVTVDGVTYNFADYQTLDHDMLAVFNYLDTLVSHSSQDYNQWNGWYYQDAPTLVHYNIAFASYAAAFIAESTPGYRTSYYKDFAYDAIERMNTSIAEYGNTSVEYLEWANPDFYGNPGYVDYYYPNPDNITNTSIYTGGWRGPANIMWTGHYALMEALYQRDFDTGQTSNELSWFIKDWNNSLTTDGHGNPKAGGIWGVGLIPCEPFIVFTQCNSIPIATTELYDSLYGTDYMPIWNYGLNFIDTTMRDAHNLTTNGYYVQAPIGHYYEAVPSTVPNNAVSPYDPSKPNFAAYGTAWTMAFLQQTQPQVTARDYPVFLDTCEKQVSGDKAYIQHTYNDPSNGYGLFDIYGTFFGMLLANQQGDYNTRDRLANWLFGPYNRVWSSDGRAMHFDTMSLTGFAQPIMAIGYIWAHAPNTVIDVTKARPSEFWNYPYISSADDNNIWVYQAQWDPVKEGFILNIGVDSTASLVFSNFNSMPTAYLAGGGTIPLVSAGSGLYSLTLSPGNYQLVIK